MGVEEGVLGLARSVGLGEHALVLALPVWEFLHAAAHAAETQVSEFVRN